MAEPSQLSQLIESFVDSSRSPTQQAASLDKIASLVKNDVLTMEGLVREMEMYLTTTDNIIRARGILLLAEVLTCLGTKPLTNATLHSLIGFFTDRLADWKALRGALVGCLALMRRKSSAGVVTSTDAKAVAQSFLQNLQVQSLGQHDRKLCFELLECLLECYPNTVAPLGDELIYGICEAIDSEKDPQCLMLTFHIVEVLVQLFPDPSGPLASFAADLFEILSCYFPIHFTHDVYYNDGKILLMLWAPKGEDLDIKRDDLSRALMLAFSSTPVFEPFAIPLLLEKLSSSLQSAKLDSLKYLSSCTLKYGSERIAKHARAIWLSIKDALYNSLQEPTLSFTSESLDGLGFQENEIAKEALMLLQQVIMQNNVKGLQILATFPGDVSPISISEFENILITFMSIITENFKKTLLWRLALRALVNIGSFIDRYHESEKILSYMGVVVEKIILLVSLDDFTMPFPLKLEAISGIGTSGLNYMLNIVQGLEEAIFANLSEIYVHGNLKSAEITIRLLECYSNKVLPWIRENGGFEEVLLRFPVNIWKQIESCVDFSVQVLEKELLDAMMTAMKHAVAFCSEESQNKIIQKAYNVLSSSTSFPLKESMALTIPFQLEDLQLTQKIDNLSCRDEWILSLFASVVIAVCPQTHIPNVKVILHLFITTLLKGHVPAAQALGSMVNKFGKKSIGSEISNDCTLEEALDIVLQLKLWNYQDTGALLRCSGMSNGSGMGHTDLCLGVANDRLPQIHAIAGLSWIGKGLLLRGHDKVKDVTMIFLECILSNGKTDALPLKQHSLENSCEQDLHASVMKCAADAFHVLMSDSEVCLNRKFHAIIRPLYKQRFFSTMMPILQPLIMKSDSSLSRSMLYRASAHIICETPLVAILGEAKKLIPILLDCLSMLNKDTQDKDTDTLYSLLLVLSGILTDKNGLACFAPVAFHQTVFASSGILSAGWKEAVVDNAHLVINCLTGLIAYPHMMLVRETAVQCLVAMSDLPHARIYPMRIQVLKAISKALDDPRRAVRQEAVRCRQAWASTASRSLHF
uniref:MMS19 nucleotide excision repair protein n=1 Tax=Fagus sylvatica TaxID=28930 RepID=A0A2N9GRY4_FAGSY